ncbi:KH domain-containing protein [Rubritalea marina]|uniref:KH domain-containing protein n=1 Tax=Rubritalea marina TaxID=361055 RepID=UPI000399EDEE|nr:KH domain-containing protein [Rubritalea marina]
MILSMQEATDQIHKFLQFITLQFIQRPQDAQLKVAEVAEDHVRFRIVLHHTDVAILIGRNGFTASAIRNVLKAAAIKHGITATLQILSHEEEKQRAENAAPFQDEHHEGDSADETDDEALED